MISNLDKMRQKSWQSLDTTTTKRTENVSYKIFTFQSWYPSLSFLILFKCLLADNVIRIYQQL
jgi:hypothetical protein